MNEDYDISNILNSEDPEDLKHLFAFGNEESISLVVYKFNLWARHFFGKFFTFEDAPFHEEIDLYNAKAYLGYIDSFLDIGFRGCAKTSRTKLFMAFCIANDKIHRKKYIKVLAEDITNSVQVTTDIYNMLITPKILEVYSEIFAKTKFKREERKDTFTTATGVKIIADTVGSSARGALQEEARPDFIWFEDFENRKTLKSAVLTDTIWKNMGEAKDSLAIGGSCLYNCNYLSERGNVHKLVLKADNDKNIKLITPIMDSRGEPTWKGAYTKESIAIKKKNTDDFEGEYMCEPSAGADVFFDREMVKKQIKKTPIRVISDFKIYHEYDPSHRYASGHDVAGGVGLDSSTSVFIDFTSFPSKVVATYKSNLIKPDIFGDEIKSQGDRFGECLVAPENNKYDMAIGRLRWLKYKKIYFQEMKDTKVGRPPTTVTLGWNTNSDTKPKMLFAVRKAIVDGHLELSDPDLIQEFWSYTRDDLMDRPEDPRLTTRHFDLLMACAIAYQMKDHATEVQAEESYQQAPYENPLSDDYNQG